MHQGDVVENRDIHFSQICASRTLKEILVVSTQYMRFADNRGLHHDDVVHVADGRNTRGSRVTISEHCQRNLTYSKTISSVRLKNSRNRG